MNKWINDLKLDKSENTIISYTSKIKKYLLWIEENNFSSIGCIDSLELLKYSSRSLYLDYLNELKENNLTNQTINIYSAAIKSALEFYEHNSSYVKSLKVKQKDRNIDIVPILNLLNTKDMAFKTLIKFMLETGLRASELQKCIIKDQEVKVIEGKGNKDRVVYISKETSNMIKEYGLVQVDRTMLYRILKPYKVSPHDIRHASATLWLQKGANIKMVQETLGHTNIATTGKYLQSSKEERAKFVGGLI